MALLLTACAASIACDVPDAPSEAIELTEISAFLVDTAASSPGELGIHPPSADTEHAPLALINKVKSPKPEHLRGWVRWANAQPFADGAVADQTGERCAMGQAGNIWYLAGTFGGPVSRECVLPPGKTLVFPLVNRWRVFPPEYFPGGEGIEETLPDGHAWYDSMRASTCGLTLRVDGQEVRDSLDELDEDFYIRVMDPFEIDLHDEHWAPEYFDGGVMPTVGDGHYAVIKPLPPGEHVIELGGEICGEYPFSTAATYHLHIGVF